MIPTGGNKTCPKPGNDDIWQPSRPRDVRIQIYISLSLGIGAFLTFCVIHPDTMLAWPN